MYKSKFKPVVKGVKISALELLIVIKLQECRMIAGSFDKKFCRSLPYDDLSSKQRWFIYKLGFKYRVQINDSNLQRECEMFLRLNPKCPMGRGESLKAVNDLLKDIEIELPEKNLFNNC